MKNNFQSNVNGQMLDGGSIEHPLSIHSASIGTRWKPRGMQLICTLVLLFTFAIGQMWAADPTYDNPSRTTYAEKTFLNVAGTQANVTGTDNYLCYGTLYMANTVTGAKFFARTAGTGGTSSSSYTYSTPATGFLAANSTSATNTYGSINANSSRPWAVYFTGATQVSVLKKDNNTSSNKWVILKLYSVASNGTETLVETAEEASPATSIKVLNCTTALSASTYYKLEITSGNTSNCAIYQVSFKQAPSCDDANSSIIADQSIFVNDELDLEFASDNVNTVSYSIKKGGSTTYDAYVTDGKFKATVAGTYVVTATQAKDASNHCAVEESVTITVNAKTPVSSVSISGDATAFIGMAKTLTASADQAVSEYKWEVDGVDQGVNAATFDFSAAAAGTYSVVCKARNSFNDPGAYISSSAHSITVTKLCGELIRATRNGKNLDPVTGVVGGTATKNTQDNGKLGSSGHYWKLVLASGNFMIGDVVTVNVSTAAGQGTLAITTDQAGANVVATAGGVGVAGDNELTITEAVGNTIWLSRDGTNNNWNGVVDAIYVTRSCAISDDCSIKSLTINGEAITPVGKVYSYEVAAASALTQVAVAYTIHPLATGTPASGFNVTVPAAGDPANTQTITVTAEDGTHSDTYTVSVSKATAASDVVTLNELAVTGYTLDPTFDAGTLAYTITKAYGADDPAKELVTYTKTEEAQDVEVTYDGTNHKLIVTVTAEDNTTTQDYEITINEAAAKRDLLEVMFSNGAKGAINAGTKEIRVPYIGSDAPTFVSAAFADWVEAGASAEMNEGKLKVIGADSNFDEYTITPVQLDVTGVALDEDITFSAVPAYIFAPYGWDSGKGVKFAKNYEQESNRRISSGNSRIYIAVPTGVATLQLTSGSAGARNVVIKVNGETSTITKTAAANSAIDLAMNPAIVNFVYIENNTGSSGGDAGFIKMHLVPAYSVTYAAGAGAVKGGETMPTQVSVAAGTEITLASGDALEKDGYDFDGWLCDIDAEKYAAGAAYTMTAAATTFTAQWVEHIVPVDPTLTYNDGAYTTGLAALDLSTLIDQKESTGAITYSVKEANGTGAAIDGVNFIATAAGTAVITASQAAVVGYNAITVDFNVVVTVPAEKDGIKMVEAAALTGNFRIKADQLKSGSYTVDGINYTKYVQMGSTHTSFSGETEGNQTKGIYYAPTKKNITFWFYMRNTDSSSRKIYIYKMEEGSSVASETVTVDPGSQLVSYDMTLSTNAEVIFGVENTKLYFCQIVAVESGDALLQGGEAGYVFDYSKKRQNIAANTLRTIDGIDYMLYAESKINSASNVQLQTLGTHYIKFHLDAPKQVSVYADNKKYYIGSECSTEDAAKLYEATGNGEFTLAAGDWYINGSGAQVKINKLEFALPKCEQPVFNALANSEICAGDAYVALDGTGTVTDGGTITYKWYAQGGEDVLSTEATYTPNADGSYYVVALHHVDGYTDNEATSDVVTVTTVASAAITAAPQDQHKVPGQNATLTVTATGKAPLSYQWYTCDENGDNAVAVDGATAASYEVEVTAGMNQYFKVVVNSACGSAEALALVAEWSDYELADVTGSMTWNWKNSENPNAWTGISSDIDITSTSVVANVNNGIIPNNADFRSDMLKAVVGSVQTKVRPSQDGGCFQGNEIMFHTTVPGVVTVTYRGTGNSANVTLTIGSETLDEYHGGFTTSKKVFVPAGDVVISSGSDAMRVQKIVFNATPDYSRTVSNNIGTLCVDHNVLAGGFLGATFYQIASRNEQYNDKIDFEEVLPTEELKAGEPYIFQSTTGRIDLFYADGDAVTEPVVVRGMHGVLAAGNLAITEENMMDVYYIEANKLRDCSNLSSLTLVANRAYIVMSEVPTYEQYTATPSAGAPRRRVTLGKNTEQVATGIDDVQGDNVQSTKVLINGQLFIIRGEKMFDATGRLVK